MMEQQQNWTLSNDIFHFVVEVETVSLSDSNSTANKVDYNVTTTSENRDVVSKNVTIPTPNNLKPTSTIELNDDTFTTTTTTTVPFSNENIVTNNTRCSQTHLSFAKETLLHIWEINGLIGYISYIKRFDQPFEIKTEEVSFKSDAVDGKWTFTVHKVRHSIPSSFSVQTSSDNQSTSFVSSATSASPSFDSLLKSSKEHIGDIRIVATYSYEAKQPRNSDFIIRPTILHGSTEIPLLPQKSSSPTIVQQKYYNTRGHQLNSNFLEYVYSFTWTKVLEPLETIKKSIFSTKVTGKNESDSNDKHWSGETSEEFFEEITQTDFSGHFGDITIKFLISAYFPEEPVSVTSSRCNSSILEHLSVNQYLLEKTSNNQNKRSPPTKEAKPHRYFGHSVPPYMRYAYSMLHDDRFSDIILVMDDPVTGLVELPAHRIILATSSPVFSAILENTPALQQPIFTSTTGSESQSNSNECLSIIMPPPVPRIIIEPSDIGVECLQEFLRYIYTGSVDSEKMRDVTFVHRLIIIADKYDLPELKRHCERILLQSLSPENAVEMYLLGIKVTSSKMMRKAMIIMKMNKGKLASQTEEFRELSMRHPTLMYELFLSH